MTNGSTRCCVTLQVVKTGCQIFLDTIYQKRGKIYQIANKLPNGHNTYQIANKLPNGHNTYQIANKLPNGHNIYQIANKLPNGHKINQMAQYFPVAIKYTNLFQFKALQKLPKLGFLFENIPSGNSG
jgi:hypothetical protein